MHCPTFGERWALELLIYTATLLGSSVQWDFFSKLPPCCGVVGKWDCCSAWPHRWRAHWGLFEVMARVRERIGGPLNLWPLCKFALGPLRTHGPNARGQLGLFDAMAPVRDHTGG